MTQYDQLESFREIDEARPEDEEEKEDEPIQSEAHGPHERSEEFSLNEE